MQEITLTEEQIEKCLNFGFHMKIFIMFLERVNVQIFDFTLTFSYIFLKRGIDYREILRISLSIMNCNSFAIT